MCCCVVLLSRKEEESVHNIGGKGEVGTKSAYQSEHMVGYEVIDSDGTSCVLCTVWLLGSHVDECRTTVTVPEITVVLDNAYSGREAVTLQLGWYAEIYMLSVFA